MATEGALRMYIPRHFVEPDQSYIKDFVRKHSFGLLVTWDGQRPLATQLVFNLIESDSNLVLFGHLARSNPQWKTFDKNAEVLSVFEGPHTYVSAAWYSVQSAPTWNYITVQAYGIAQIVEDKTELFGLLRDLVDKQEESTPAAERYHIEAMPKRMAEDMMSSLVGFRINVTRIECAAKLSQNRNQGDYSNIIGKLRTRNDSDSIAIAEEMDRRGRLGGKESAI